MNSQESVHSSSGLPRWPGYLLAVYAIGVGVLALLSMKLSPAGWGILTRPLLGVWAVAGGLLLLLGDPWWKPLLRFWTLAQAVIILLDPSGELTRQPGLWLAVTSASSTTTNGRFVELQGYGVNFAGVILFLVTNWIIARKWHPLVPVRFWQFQVLRVVRLLFLGIHLSVLVHEGWRWAPLFLEKDRLLVIDCPFPGAEVYREDRKLGSTPLVVTHDKLVSWDLSKPAGRRFCQLSLTSVENGLALIGGSSSAEILFKAPAWCAQQFQTMRTPWGLRTVPDLSRGYSSNWWTIPLLSKAQPGLVLGEPSVEPAVARAGEPVQFTLELRHNPPDPRLTSPPPLMDGQRAELGVIFWKQKSAAYHPTTIALPPAWARLGVGQVATHSFKLPAPAQPGTYTVHCKYRLLENTNRPTRFDAGWVRSYGTLEVR